MDLVDSAALRGWEGKHRREKNLFWVVNCGTEEGGKSAVGGAENGIERNWTSPMRLRSAGLSQDLRASLVDVRRGGVRRAAASTGRRSAVEAAAGQERTQRTSESFRGAAGASSPRHEPAHGAGCARASLGPLESGMEGRAALR